MKILLVNIANFSKSEGASIHQTSIARWLLKKKYEVKILTPKRKKDHEYKSIKNSIVFTPSFGDYLPGSFDSFLQIPLIIKYRFKNYKILYSRLNSMSFFLITVAKLLGFKVVLEHNTILSEDRKTELNFNNNFIIRFEKMNQIISSRIADKNRCVTEQISNYLFKNSIPKEKLVVIGNGSFFLSRSYPNNKYKKYIFDKKNYFYVGYAGSLSNYEGLENLITCAKYCRSIKKKVKFIIAGDGPNRVRLENLAIDEGLINQFDFIGYVKNSMIKSIIKNFDISIAPLLSSRNYKTGLSSIKIRDYCASKSVVLTSHIHEHVNLSSLNVVFTFKNNTSRSIAEAINFLIKNPNLRKTLANNAYNYSLKNFSWDKIGKRIENELLNF